MCLDNQAAARRSQIKGKSGDEEHEIEFAAVNANVEKREPKRESKFGLLPARERKVSNDPAISNGRAKLTGTSLEHGSS